MLKPGQIIRFVSVLRKVTLILLCKTNRSDLTVRELFFYKVEQSRSQPRKPRVWDHFRYI